MLLLRLATVAVVTRRATVYRLLGVAHALRVVHRRPVLALQLVLICFGLLSELLGVRASRLALGRRPRLLETVFDLESLNLELLLCQIINKLAIRHLLRS